MALRPVAPPSAGALPQVRTLGLDDLPRLRLDAGLRIGTAAARRVVASYPGRSVWIPETHEFALLAPWRHRSEIALVQELDAVANAERLLVAARERSQDLGAELLLVVEMEEVRRPRFYTRAGLEPLETVVTYELVGSAPSLRRTGHLAFERVDPADGAAMAELLRLDHATFPWLWWNSAEEFAAYAATSGVRLFLGREGGTPVAYVGVTTYPGWGHLDRIAVDPTLQGKGLGRQTLAFAVDALFGAGARRIALSTQGTNVRSQRLYEGAGFRRSPDHDYRLYGARLRPSGNEEGEQQPWAAVSDRSSS